MAAGLPTKATDALDFTGRFAAALPKTVAAPGSVDWRSLPRLIQEIGADALLVTSAANLLVGIIIGFLGVSQLGRFGAIVYVPELVVVAHFRELGPLVTAIVVAGRSGAGLASEIATMKVSEEIDALRSMGFDPVRWLVVPRCLALAVTVPLLTWVGDVLALIGGLRGHDVDHRHDAARLCHGHRQTPSRPSLFFAGLVKSPFLALAIGLIACGQGLATRGWRRRRRRPHDDRRGAGHLRRDRDQRAVHAFLRADGHLTWRHPGRTSSSRICASAGARECSWSTSASRSQRGTTFAILGGSGSGKSTLLRYLIGLERPMAGESTSTASASRTATRACRPSACSFSRARSSAP